MPLIISEDYTDVLAEKLRAGDIDAAILSLPFEHPGIVTQNLYDEPFVIALPKDHRLSKRKKLNPEDLANETLLLLKARNCFRDQVLEACPFCLPTTGSGAAQGDLAETLESSSLETIRQMTALGAGVTVLPVTSTGERSTAEQATRYQAVYQKYSQASGGNCLPANFSAPESNCCTRRCGSK